MHTIATVAQAWRFPGLTLAVCAALLLSYGLASGLRPLSALAWFAAGNLLLAAILCSPLDVLARNYLFTAEAIEKILLTFTVPYMLLRGLTATLMRRLHLARIRLPYQAAWIAGMGTLSVWFLPSLLNASLQRNTVRAEEIATLIAGGAIFWWPLHSPLLRERISLVPHALIYLAAATVWCSLLGLFLTFEQPWSFARYANPLDTLQISESLVRDWSFTRENDQQTGGLLFWIGSATVLLSEVMFTYYRWYKKSGSST